LGDESVPAPSDYTGTAWFVDPENYMLYELKGPNEYGTEPISMQDLTGGLYTVSSGAIRNAENGRVAQWLDPLNSWTATVGESGSIFLTRESPISQLNAETSATTRRGLIGEATLITPEGPAPVAIDEPWLSAPGSRIIVLADSKAGDPGRFRSVDLYDKAGNRVEPLIEPGWRYATGQEVQDRAVASWLMHTHAQEVREMIEGDPEVYGTSEVGSESVSKLLAALNLDVSAMIGTELM
jgi:hypothetical protein